MSTAAYGGAFYIDTAAWKGGAAYDFGDLTLSVYSVFLLQKSINQTNTNLKENNNMEFFNQAVTVLQTLVIALGAGLGIWGVINLLEGYGNDNPGAKSQGMKQLMAGGGVALIGMTLVPLLSGLF